MASKLSTLKTDWQHVCADNVTAEVIGNILTLTVDLTKNRGLSSTGKSIVVASTKGFIAVGSHPGIAIGLNVTKKA